MKWEVYGITQIAMINTQIDRNIVAVEETTYGDNDLGLCEVNAWKLGCLSSVWFDV